VTTTVADFEAGTNGNTITAGTGNQYTSRTIGSGAALTYANTHPAHGSLAMKIVNASSVSTYAEVNTLNNVDVSSRYYLYCETVPTVATTIEQFRTSGGQTANLTITSAGKLQTQNSAGSTVATATTALSANTLYRIEMQVHSDASAGTIAMSYFAGDGTSAIQTLSNNTLNTRGGAQTIRRLGIPVSTSTFTGAIHFDDDLLLDGSLVALGPTITLTETGTGTDAMTVAAALSVTETGSGTDALTVAATLALAETGAGTDALTTTATLAVAETATGADALTTSATTSVADTATGTDALTVAASLALAETGTAVDALAVSQTQAVSLTETSAATDDMSVAVSLALAETGTADDVLVVTQGQSISLSDTAAFADDITVTASSTLDEIGAFGDSLSLAAALELAETAAWTDLLTIHVEVPPRDLIFTEAFAGEPFGETMASTDPFLDVIAGDRFTEMITEG